MKIRFVFVRVRDFGNKIFVQKSSPFVFSEASLVEHYLPNLVLKGQHGELG